MYMYMYVQEPFAVALELVVQSLYRTRKSSTTFEIEIFTGMWSTQLKSLTLFQEVSLLVLCRSRSVDNTCDAPQLVDPVTSAPNSPVHDT